MRGCRKSKMWLMFHSAKSIFYDSHHLDDGERVIFVDVSRVSPIMRYQIAKLRQVRGRRQVC